MSLMRFSCFSSYLRSAISGVILTLTLSTASTAATCDFGAEVISKDYCSFFVTYRTGLSNLDQRIGQRVGAKSSAETRSIALIIGNSFYPNLPEKSRDLHPAKNDARNLVKFLDEQQKFDEVILLENDKATRDNIDYFLSSYIPNIGLEYNGKARFLMAYSGHGLNETHVSEASFLLSNATSVTDVNNMYTMSNLREKLQNISKNYFHVLALINSCYGGNIFNVGSNGGNPSNSEKRGSYALTAGPDDKTVASFGRENDGSVFFDAMIRGITTGEADLDYARVVSSDGTLLQQGGVTRLGALSSYLVSEIEIINHKKIATANGPLFLDKPWIGPVEANGRVASGGFFFLSPVNLVSRQIPVALDIPPGPVSSLPGRPDIKVFNAQEEYPIKGIDVSQHEGKIDWNDMYIIDQKNKTKTKIDFAYIRAFSWAGIDKKFSESWRGAHENNIDVGAYSVYDFCLSPQEQFKIISSVVENQGRNLPFAIIVQKPGFNINKWQYRCFERSGLKKARSNLHQLLQLIRENYGKTPLISGNKTSISYIVDETFNEYMLWLALYTKSNAPVTGDVQFSGSNPWTMWQYTPSLNVSGVGLVTGNVFFGTEKQYEIFKDGRGNIALDASLSK